MLRNTRLMQYFVTLCTYGCLFNYSFLTAYKEKMKELSMFSLICSCFNPRLQKNLDSKTDCKIYFLYLIF